MFNNFKLKKNKPLKTITLVKVTPNDWQKFKELRLKALQTDSIAFGRLYEDEINNTEADWRAKLVGKDQGVGDYYFAQVDGELVGMGGIKYEKGKRIEHMVTLSAIYVDPKYRGQGIGEQFVRNLVEKLKADPKIVKIRLSVQTTQVPAIKMYEKLGFKQSGYSRNEVKYGNKYIDQIQMEMIFEDKIEK